MVIHMIAFLGIGAAVFAFVYAIRHLSGWRLPSWWMPAAAGVAMLGYSVWAEYSWAGRTAEALPEGVAVVWQGGETVGYRPWTLVFPAASRLIALDRRAPLRHEAQPGVVILPVFLVARWQPTATMTMAFDCIGGRQAELGEAGDFGTDGALAGADWRAADPEDPLIRAACMGG